MARAHALRPLHAGALEIIDDPPTAAVASAAEHHFTGQGGQPRATFRIMHGTGGHMEGDRHGLQARQSLAKDHNPIVERRRMKALFRHQADRLPSRVESEDSRLSEPGQFERRGIDGRAGRLAGILGGGLGRRAVDRLVDRLASPKAEPLIEPDCP